MHIPSPQREMNPKQAQANPGDGRDEVYRLLLGGETPGARTSSGDLARFLIRRRYPKSYAGLVWYDVAQDGIASHSIV